MGGKVGNFETECCSQSLFGGKMPFSSPLGVSFVLLTRNCPYLKRRACGLFYEDSFDKRPVERADSATLNWLISSRLVSKDFKIFFIEVGFFCVMIVTV